MYGIGFGSANLLKMSLVIAAAVLTICLLALAETANTAEATSPPQNGKIAFTSSNRSGDSSGINTLEPDGSDLSKLTDGTPLAWRPIWSPDGTEMAFSHRAGFLVVRHATSVERFSIEGFSVMNADGSDPRKLYKRQRTWGFGPTWAPDGKKLAFSSGGPPLDTHDIYTMNPDGSNLTNLTKPPGLNESYPDFSPNGSKICFTHYGTGTQKATPGIYVMDADGSNPTLLANDESGAGAECDWSPDGKKITFHAFSDAAGDDHQKAADKALAEGNLEKAQEEVDKLRAESNNAEVYVMNADGSGRTALTSDSASDASPRWSPDGTRITFSSDRDGDSDIYTMDADGSEVVQVTNWPNDEGNPDWQPLPETTPPKDANGPDVDQGTKKPGVEDVDRDRPESTVIVKPGDSLWSISEERLGPESSPQQVYDHTYQMYALNRNLIGADPNLIFAGQRLSLPPLRYVTH